MFSQRFTREIYIEEHFLIFNLLLDLAEKFNMFVVYLHSHLLLDYYFGLSTIHDNFHQFVLTLIYTIYIETQGHEEGNESRSAPKQPIQHACMFLLLRYLLIFLRHIECHFLCLQDVDAVNFGFLFNIFYIFLLVFQSLDMVAQLFVIHGIQ